MVCANCATSPMSCPTSITAASIPVCSFPSVCMICRCTTTSSALVGSSARITFGLRHVAIASTALCFIPPLSS